jgi:hypothetical protein
MFDLDKAIAEWRRQMADGGIKASPVLNELESHLRDEFERQMTSGVPPQNAFEIAVQRIGQPGVLQNEFTIANAETRRQRLKYALLKFLGLSRTPRPAFSASAQKTLELGGKEALGFHHDFIGTEHVLLGLLQLETGVVAKILGKLGVDHRVVRSEIEKVVGSGPIESLPSSPVYTPRVKKALELAGREACAHNHGSISAEHIFLGLLLEGGGLAALVLKHLGVDIQAAREQTLRELARNQSAS